MPLNESTFTNQNTLQSLILILVSRTSNRFPSLFRFILMSLPAGKK